MEQTLGILTGWAFVLAQVFLGLWSYWRNRNLHRRFNYRLVNGASAVDVLEKYIQVEESINVRVHAPISTPAAYREDILMLNRDFARSPALYPVVFTMLQIALGRPGNELLRHYHKWQLGLFILEIITIILASLQDIQWAIVSIGIGVLLMALSVWVYFLFGEMVIDGLDLLFVLIDLLPAERSTAAELSKNLREGVFKYGFTPIYLVVKFLIPKLQ